MSTEAGQGQYSSLTAVGVVLGASSADAARSLNALCAALLVVLAFFLARRHMDSRLGPILVAMAVAFGPAWTHVSVQIMSETVFGVLVLVFLLLLDRIAQRAQVGELEAKHLIAAGVVAGSSCAVRYLGLALIASGIMAVLLLQWRGSRSRAIKLTGWFLLWAIVAPLILVIHNVAVGSGPFGSRQGAATATLAGTAREFLDVTRTWVTTIGGHGFVDVLTWLVVVALTGLVLVALVWTPGRRHGARHAQSVAPLVIVVVTMTGWLILSALATPIDAINLRLAAPIFAPALVLVGWSLEGLTGRETAQRWQRFLVVAVVISWVLVTGLSAVRYSVGRDHGYSVLRAADPGTPLTGAVKALPRDALIFSNNPWRLWAATDRPASLSPRRSGYRSTETTGDLAVFVQAVSAAEDCGRPVFLVWYEVTDDVGELYPLDALQNVVVMSPSALSSGADSLFGASSTSGTPTTPCASLAPLLGG